MEEHMLTTIDNPYNPFTQFDEWDAWDRRSGYHTTALLARIVISSDELSETDQSEAIEQAINEILDDGLNPMLIRVTATSAAKLIAANT